jgi:hypothetical protein
LFELQKTFFFSKTSRFNNETKNYKLFYDGAFYVGEKRFDNINDLVHDGLISFYIEKHASNYIAMMCEENNYSESPYVASKAAFVARQQKQTQIQPTSNNFTTHNPSINQHAQQIPAHSVHNSFQKQHQQVNHQQQHQHSHHQQYPQQQQHNTSNNISMQQFLNSQIMNNNLNTNTMLNQFDKENRHSSIKINNALKSNAIFDRFDIMNSEKPHKFKSQNFKGPHWCDFCLNFMWGLVSQGVKCQDCGFQAHKKCSERAPPDCEPQMRFIKRIFGVDLTTLVKATSSIRPIIVEKCIEEIEKRKGAIECEGIYRVSGFSDAIEELKLAFDRGNLYWVIKIFI